MYKLFKNREEGAVQLAIILAQYKNQDALVLALPKGGIPIGHVIAKELNIPLDVSLCEKIKHPIHEDYPIASINTEEVIINYAISNEYIQSEINQIKEALRKTYQLFRGDQKPLELKNKIVIVTDDGIATGSKTLMTVKMAKKQGAAQVIVAAPVISPSATNVLKNEADRVIALAIPRYFMAVGQFYEDFRKPDNEEIIKLLKESQNLSIN